MKIRLIDADKLIDSLRASMNHGRETFSVDLIVEAINEQPTIEYTEQMSEDNKLCNKEIHAYQNEDATYRVEINEGDTLVSIEKADINITAYATKNDKKLMSFTIKE